MGLENEGRAQLVETLEFLLNQNAQAHGITLEEKGYDKRVRELIIKLSNTNRAVILVDEYAKPLIDYVENQEIAKENRKVLKTFYGAIKGADEYLEFVFITGVSKFSKVSIFSGLNNLNDISVDDKFATLLGYTHDELLCYFQDSLEKHAIADIKRWYNGYSWDGKNFVYNPLSVLLFFEKGKIGNYWFSTGTPTFLIKSIREFNIDIKRLENYETTNLLFDSYDIETVNLFALLFQTGYLTIKEVAEVSPTQSIYKLSYPNQEVKESLLDYITADYTGKPPDEIGYLIYKLQDAIVKNDLEGFFSLLKSIFAKIPYDIFVKEREAYYHTIIYLVVKLLGLNIDVEVETNIGRIDAVLKTGSHIYIMEYKMGTAREALGQIKEKKYVERYLPTDKKIQLVGVGFSIEQKNIHDYRVEEFPA